MNVFDMFNVYGVQARTYEPLTCVCISNYFVGCPCLFHCLHCSHLEIWTLDVYIDQAQIDEYPCCSHDFHYSELMPCISELCTDKPQIHECHCLFS
jgi:hypothetical protein